VRLLLAVIAIGAVEDEVTFWIQLLMIVILAAGAGTYVMVKSRAKRIERQTRDETIETIIARPAVSFANPEPGRRVKPPKPLVTGHAFPERPVVSEIKPRRRDLSGGMELLARNFLTGVVEQTDSSDQRDIEMRRLCFTELTRRGELWAIASAALKVYTLDKDGFYGKIIRCEAMAELAGRTTDKPQNTAEAPPASPQNQEQAESASRRTG
jgi:hypothetical protein